MNPDQQPSSEDEFEKRLRDVPLRTLDPSWKEEVLDNFSSKSSPETDERSWSWWFALPRAVAFPLILIWAAIGFFQFGTSIDRERPSVMVTSDRGDPGNLFYEQRLAALCLERQRQFGLGQQ